MFLISRLWLSPRSSSEKKQEGETVTAQSISFKDFLPEKQKNDDFTSLVNRTNSRLSKGSIEGRKNGTMCRLDLFHPKLKNILPIFHLLMRLIK